MDWLECPECGVEKFQISRDYKIQCVDCGWTSRLHNKPAEDHRPIGREPGEKQPDREDVFWF